MLTADALRQTVQAIVGGPWQHAARALAACREGSWPDFVAANAPPAPMLVGRFDHRACVRRAAETFSGPMDVVVELIPIWVAHNPDEAPVHEWPHAWSTSDWRVLACHW